ncbi:MAG: hypothetical protein JNL98_36725 [Bryobacterales bacterium]|nr:hypothetical protein [Bryobacterales bacterium]
MNLILILAFLFAIQPAWTSPKPIAVQSVRFEANRGQTDAEAHYFARARNQHIFFTADGIVFDPSSGTPVRMRFEGAGKAVWTPAGDASDSISYYIGNDPSRWVKGAPVYDRVAWRGVYPGIDAFFYDRGGNVEYDLVLSPGADPSLIRLRFTGASSIRASADGAIEITAGGATLRQHAPEIYQEDKAGKRRRVEGRLIERDNGEFRLQLGDYEKSRPLVIDPVLEASTYVGGENDDEIVVVNEAFIAGNTRSAGFPGAIGSRRRSRDVFITGLGFFRSRDWRGTTVVGGSGDDQLTGVAITGGSNVDIILGGITNSRDLPFLASQTYQGGASDGFFATLNIPNRSPLLNIADGRYIGGSGADRIHSFAPFGSLNGVLFAGSTDSDDLDARLGEQRTIAGGTDVLFGLYDRFFGSSVGYLGGSGDDVAHSVLPDQFSRVIYVAGETRSPGFPSGEPSLRGPSDAFLTEMKYSDTVPSLRIESIVSRRIGGSGEDSIRSIAPRYADGFGFVSSLPQGVGIAGVTTSPDLPVRNAAQPSFGGESDAFAGLWIPESSSFAWLTYLGGAGADSATSSERNLSGDLVIGGWTRSTNLKTVDALQPASGGGQDGMFGFLDADGVLRHLTYFGGSGDDRIEAVAALPSGSIRVGGVTTSGNLPLHRATQSEYGERSDGFVAEIGTDYLSGPSELLIPKDGFANLNLRPARSAFRPAITYRSSDPSRLRFVYVNRSLGELTSAAGSSVTLEALADSGEVEVTATADGFATKTIAVKLRPGVLVLGRPIRVSSWTSRLTTSLSLRTLDPATGQPGVTAYGIRREATPSVTWASSNPAVVEVGPALETLTANLLVRGVGQSRITASAEGWRVIEVEPLIIDVQPPQPIPVETAVVPQGFQAVLPFRLSFGTQVPQRDYRGSLTVRSEDPSRLVLSLSRFLRGTEQITASMDGAIPPIFAQALASSGEVRVIFTSSEFAGEFPITVRLERAVLRWGTQRTVRGVREYLPEISLDAGSQRLLGFSVESESGNPASEPVPGAPPPAIRLSNSNPRVVSLNRLTALISVEGVFLRGLNPGTARLSVSVSPDTIQLENSSVTVTVPPPAETVLPEAVLGKDLQMLIQVRTAQSAPVTVTSSDATALLVSSGGPGAAEVSTFSTPDGDVQVWIQALKGQGETTIRVRAPGQPDRVVPVVLVPSGVALSEFAGRVTLSIHALDEESATPLAAQQPRPGVSVPVTLRAEGGPVGLARTAYTLSSSAASANVEYSPLLPGTEAVLIADAPGFTASRRSRLRLRGPESATVPTSQSITVVQHTVTSVELTTSSAATVTSSDPSKLLLSIGATASPSASVNTPAGQTFLQVHALAGSGNAEIRVDAEGRQIRQITVAFSPLEYSQNTVRMVTGQTWDLAHRSDLRLRPGVSPFRFSVRTADPTIATIAPSSFEWPTTGIAPALRITAVAPGITLVIGESPESVYFHPFEIVVDGPSTTPQQFTVGKNTQSSLAYAFGRVFENGAIVTVTSSDPSKLVLSRSGAITGSGSVTVAVPPGQPSTQEFFLQARGQQGEVTLRIQTDGGISQTATVRIVNSWFACTSGPDNLSIAPGGTERVQCVLRIDTPPQNRFDSAGMLPDAGSVSLRLRSSDPSVFTVSPETAPFVPGRTEFQLRGVRPGYAVLLVEQPEGFGPAGPSLGVTVRASGLETNCRTVSLGKDTQQNCQVPQITGVPITAESSDPSLTLVSNSATEAGAAQAVTSSGRITIQQLARYGTSEVVLSAPGYGETRIPVVAGETDLVLQQGPGVVTELNLRAGEFTVVTLTLNTSGPERRSPRAARAGSSIPVSLTASPSGIIAIEPATPAFPAGESAVNITIRALATGSTVLRVNAPEGINVPVLPIAVTVRP